ncbi:GDSL family lipase [Heyndrickxia shackletonii]|uniref:GDSL family lipase n=1 Tax=Heyndrickxia shackletonii TaxID=157838 RepID=A0A0Q3TK92_9BACI|nr:GDSL-type esterase/lipase family protein [Heyndrickxia shackletonii]KQL54414.1 GDSL family lipase [Heyndrickxia shackletonii]MBB2479635.1 SGNH/GDSL hydrolase family protein [Bacillus sp. APMAM]
MKIGLVGDSLTEGRPGVSFINFLRERYPKITFVNLGKPGETIKSLHTRLTKTVLETDYELIFLWIGVNDVYSKMLKVQAQPVTCDYNEFQSIFTEVMEMITVSTKQVVTVSPAVVGENVRNEANEGLRELSAIIQSISQKYSNATFLNMQSVFENYLVNVNSSDYLSTSIFRVMKDVLFYKNPKRINRLSKSRGLYLTLDGIHLNSRGAEMVADEYSNMIEQLL